tara:strand:+ start:204 stop:392 length:189 start_codon:yes stop_codon:yes gene_type:complete
MVLKKNNDEKIRLLQATAINACNEYIDCKFRDSDYESYTIEEKLRIIKVLKTNARLDARYQA